MACKIYKFFIIVDNMTYCKQGEIWLCNEEDRNNKYIVLSEDRSNRRMNGAICMRLVEEVGRGSDYLVPIYSRNIDGNLWADITTITMKTRLHYRLSRVSKMEQVREILHSFSRLFGDMCYVPVFGYNPLEYVGEVKESTEPIKKVTNVSEKGWKKVKGGKRR